MPVTPDTPELRLVFWELTARCNLKCKHCRAEAQDEVAPNELTTDEILAAVDDIRATGDPIMILTGGEPLVRPDFFQIAERCVDRFSRVALATNGTLIDDALAQRIRDVGIKRVSISLDGATAAVHDAFRGQTGCFEAALNGINALRNAGVPVQINTTVTRDNEDDLPALLQMSLDLNAAAFHLFMLVPVGCGAEISNEQRLSPERFEDILLWLADQTEVLRARLQIKATCAPQYYRIVHEKRRDRGTSSVGLQPASREPGSPRDQAPAPPPTSADFNRLQPTSADRPTTGEPSTEIDQPGTRHRDRQPPHGHGHPHGMDAHTRGCLAGSAVCFISRTGEVQPCGYLPVSAGNVRDQHLRDIWSQAQLFQTLRNPSALKGKCGACGFRKLCGGCRARAYAETGDYMDAEPDCPYEPGTRP